MPTTILESFSKLTMPTRLLFLSAFWVTCTFGQNAPVTVVKTIPHFGQHAISADGHGGNSEDMAIEYRNDSDKEIVEVKFRVFILMETRSGAGTLPETTLRNTNLTLVKRTLPTGLAMLRSSSKK
jgi:hypothetical protein